MGVRGPKGLTKEILEKVKNFLKTSLNLTVNEDKTHTGVRLTHIFSDKAKFLGMEITCRPAGEVRLRRSAHVERFRRLGQRVSRKIKSMEEKRDRDNVKGFISLLKEKLSSKEEKVNPDTMADLTGCPIEQMGILLKEELSKLNDRSIIKKLAREFNLKIGEPGNQEIEETIEKLRIPLWSKSTPCIGKEVERKA